MTVDHLIKCAEKEYRRREFSFPKQVEDGKMTAEFADFQLRAMGEICQTLHSIKKGETPRCLAVAK
ncbi:MAG: hypothetical protein ABL962_21980 [Fimbriimonadaceae bacterium]